MPSQPFGVVTTPRPVPTVVLHDRQRDDDDDDGVDDDNNIKNNNDDEEGKTESMYEEWFVRRTQNNFRSSVYLIALI